MVRNAISLLDPPAPDVSFPVLAKGFRPFFLMAGLFAALYMPVWAWMFMTGHASEYMPTVVWHAHEMLHGFAIAVIAGFLLTAVSNWTREGTAEGGLLAGLVGLWLVGRLALLASLWIGEGAHVWVAVADLLFLPALAVAIGVPIYKTRNRRNYGFPVILMAIWTGNLLTHLDVLGFADGWAMRATHLTLHMILVIIVLVTGRIVPLFTRNALDDESVRSNPIADRLALLLVIGFTIFSVLALEPVTWIMAGLLASVLIWRSMKWGAWKSRRVPLLWILHFGNAWLILGFGLIALNGLGWVASSVAIHALTTGVVGVLCLGMMSRVSRGHTGRTLDTDTLTVVAFYLMVGAVLTRVLVPIFLPSLYMNSIGVSAVLWSLAFLLFLTQHARMLLTPRPDGRPG